MNIHSKIKARRKELDLSLEDVAAQVGVTWQTVQQWERAARGTAPNRKRHNKVAEVLKTTTAYLFTNNDDEPPPLRPAEEPEDNLIGELLTFRSTRVPVVGEARLGADGYYEEYDYPVGHGEGYVVYPMRDPNTYALRCKGNSMSPRIQHGEFVVIEPNRSVSPPKDEVMVKTLKGAKMIKVLSSRKGETVVLTSINSEDQEPITMSLRDIEAMHYVGGILKASQYYPYEAA